MYQRRDPKTGKRSGCWYIRVGGVRVSSGTTDKARAKWKEEHDNQEIWDRANGRVTPTWERACLDWMDNNPVVGGSYTAKKCLAFWKDHLKGKKLYDITPKLVHGIVTGSEKFAVDLQNPVPGNATANGYVAFVSRVIRHASNLNPKLTYYPKSHGRDRWLTVEEWNRLAAVMPADLRDVSLFGLSTGLREANDMGFQWPWLKDNDTWALIPPEFTKTEKPYGIPLNLTAQGVIRRRREAPVRHPEFVFLNNGNPWYRVALCRAVRNAVGASGIEPITYHGLRHTFASWLAQRGVSQAIRARLGCWSTGSQADHYSHFDVGSLMPYAGLIDEILAGENTSRENASA